MCVTGSKLRKVRLATVELNRPLSFLNSLEESANGSYLQPSHCSNRLHEWMEGCMDAWMNGCMDGYMDGVGQWVVKWMDRWMGVWMDECMSLGWVSGWMADWIDEWVGG